MRAPDFWWRNGRSLLAWLLTPLAWLYAFFAGRRLAIPGRAAAVPVICIGNFTVGGAGKTPTAIKIARILKESGEKPFFLSRGYGGTEKGPVLVDDERHGAEQVGDEPLLLSRHAPTIVSRDRVSGAELCSTLGASVIVMDDGMQNPYLAKDLTITVVDGQTGIGNGLPFPAGPLRLAMAKQWPLSDMIIVIGPGSAGGLVAETARTFSKPAFNASLVPDSRAVARLAGRSVLAFAGIGRPEKFFASLRTCGALVERQREFPDHHLFSDAELASLAKEAEENNLLLVTTEKDRARLPGAAEKLQRELATLPVELAFLPDEDTRVITKLVQQSLAGARSKRRETST